MPEWNTYIKPEQEMVDRISKLTNLSTEDEWMDVLEEMDERYCYRHYLCNFKNLDESPFPNTKWTFQHHAACHHAPKKVVKTMREKGFAMSFIDSDGKLPKDYLPTDVEEEYKQFFAPDYGLSKLNIHNLALIEKNLHKVINSRVKRLVDEHNLILPLLSVLLEQQKMDFGDDESNWCPIPGMYGGFNIEIHLNEDDTDVDYLETSSWCRVAGGSGQRHKCFPEKWELVEEGFC